MVTLDFRFRGNDGQQLLCREFSEDGGGVETKHHQVIKVAEVVMVVAEGVVGVEYTKAAGG